MLESGRGLSDVINQEVLARDFALDASLHLLTCGPVTHVVAD